MLRQLVGMANPLRVVRYTRDLWRNGRKASRQSTMSLLRMAGEQVGLYLLNGLGASEYYRYRLFDPSLGWWEKRSFMSGEEVYAIREKLNPLIYRYLFKNKLLFKRFFTNAGFPVARLYGVFDPAWGRGEDGSPLRTVEELGSWLRSLDADEMVLKPIESAEGRMVVILQRKSPGDREEFVALDGQQYDAKAMVDHMSDPRALSMAYPDGDMLRRAFLIEERVHQHPELGALCGETLCCVRVVTLYCDDGSVDILGVVFKLETSNSGVDNLNTGSLAVGVDMRTGRLREGRRITDSWDVRREALPNGQRLSDSKLPYWREALELARQAACAFPYARAIGWDVAFSDKGPVLLEGNWGWDALSPQMAMHKGMMTPALYRAMNGKTRARPAAGRE